MMFLWEKYVEMTTDSFFIPISSTDMAVIDTRRLLA